MILLSESQYFPAITLIKAAIEYSNIKFDLYDDYRKMSFRNRCVVAGSNGPVNLSIPLVEGRNQRRPMHAVYIDNRRHWQSQHWKTITSCYNRSPWFEFYKSELEAIYRQPVEKLAEWNRICWNWVVEKLEAGIVTSYTEEYLGNPGPDYADWRNRLTPRSVQAGFPEPPRYYQVFEDRVGFQSHLSVLDLLFCAGRRSAEMLNPAKIPN